MATDPENTFTGANVSRPGTHHVKCHPEYFELAMSGDKNFEVRWNDRDYQIRDHLVVHEWEPERGSTRVADGYTGRDMKGTIGCVLGPADLPGIKEGYVVLGVSWFPSKGA